MTENDFYVAIEDPDIVRKEIFESSKAFLITVGNYEKIKVIRAQKYKEMKFFQHKIRDLTLTISELKIHLPQYKIEDLKKEKLLRFKSGDPSQDLADIESELRDIQMKFKELE